MTKSIQEILEEQRQLSRLSTKSEGQLSIIISATGRPKSLETCALLSARLKGKPKSAEHRAKTGLANKGKTISLEQRATIRATAIKNGISGKNGRPIKTPNGVFATVRAAGQQAAAEGVANAHKKIRRWLKEFPNDYYYISQEEYVRLK